MRSERRQHGFTLLELMIVVIVVGILAAIAIPSYQEQVKRSRRAAAQSEMMNVASLQHQMLPNARAYAANFAGLGYTLPADVDNYYDCSTTSDNTATPPTFSVTCTATGTQTSDGNLSLNHLGVKTPASKW